MHADVDELWAELEAEGEDAIRRKVALGQYAVKKPAVEEWLRRKEEQRALDGARQNAAESARSEKHARRAAWTSAIAAVVSAAFAAAAFFLGR